MAETYFYEKYDIASDTRQYCPMNDENGEITGKCIIGLKEWFDENPEERKRLGWTKHITHKTNEMIGYDPQTMYALKSIRRIDEYTVEDVFHLVEKSEEMMLFEEMYETLMNGSVIGGLTFLNADPLP